MRILHFTHGSADYLPPPLLSEAQIIAGPAQIDEVAHGQLRTVKTEPGAFDAEVVFRSIPVEQRPELVVVRADSSGLCRPRNLSVFGCPAVLVIGDTHHQSRPISCLIEFALSEDFCFVGLDYTRQHAHFFAEAGVSALHWIPGFNQCLWPRTISAEQSARRCFSFVGQTGKFHLRRQLMLQELSRRGVPIEARNAPREVAIQLHASAVGSFNCSLNGDLNLRVLEVLSAGGALLTDRLSPEAGLDLLFEDSEHLMLYASIDECVDRAKAMLEDPDECRAMAARGCERWQEILHPDRVRARFFGLLRGHADSSFMALHHEPRVCLSTDPLRRLSLQRRCRAYEAVQAQHLLNEETAVVASGSVDPDLLVDLVDLPHAAVAVLDGSGEPSMQARRESLLERVGLANRVGCQRSEELEALEVLLVSKADLGAAWMQDLLVRYPDTRVIFDSQVTAQEVAGFGLVESRDAADTWCAATRDPIAVRPPASSVAIPHFFQDLDGWFTFPALYLSLVKLLPEGARFVEVGSWKGKSLAFFLVEMRNRARHFEVYAVDTWEGSPEHAGMDSIVKGSLFEEFKRNLLSLEGLFAAIRAPSLQAAGTFADESLDAVFIDAGHEYEDVIADLHAWHPKVRTGGYLCGHDYSLSWPGVMKAVDEFYASRPTELISRGDEYCWVARKR